MKCLFKYLLIALLFFINGPVVNAQSGRFDNEISAFKKQDSISFPPKNAILFIGSSSFRMWKNIGEDFPGYTIINRGFGGSTLLDVIDHADELIFPYEPRQVVIYAGDNDLASSDTITSQMVVDRFKNLFFLIRDRMPAVPVVFVSIKPSPSRERLLLKMKEANKAIKDFLKKKANTSYVDVFDKMTGRKDRIKTDLFLEDNLHMNAKGYAIWKELITAYLLKD
ncbi:MAG: GDSL-type esterase/lipase family protein [Ferruginibacter sp.]